MLMCTKLCQRNWPVAARFLPGQFSLGFSYSNLENPRQKALHQAIIASQWIEVIKSHKYSDRNLTLNQFIKSEDLKTKIEEQYKSSKKKKYSSEPSQHDMNEFTNTYENLRRQFFIEGKQINRKIFSQARLTDARQNIRDVKIVFFPTQFSTQNIFKTFSKFQAYGSKKQYIYYGTAGISKTFSFVLLVLLTNYVNYFRYKDEFLDRQYNNLISLPRIKFIYGSVQIVQIGQVKQKNLKTNTQLKEQFHEMSEQLKNINDYEEIKSTIKRQFEQKNIEIIPIIDQTNKMLSQKRLFVESFGNDYKHKERQQALESIQFKNFLSSYQYFKKFKYFGDSFILNNSEMCQFSLLSDLNSQNKEFVKDFSSRMSIVNIGGHDQIDIFTSPFKNSSPTTQRQILEFFLFQINKQLQKHSPLIQKNEYLQKTLNLKRQNAQQDKQLKGLEKQLREKRNFHFNETFLQIRTYIQQRFSELNIQTIKNQIQKDSKVWLNNFIKQYFKKLSHQFDKALQKYWQQETPKFVKKLSLHQDITTKAKEYMKYTQNKNKFQSQQQQKQYQQNAQKAKNNYYNHEENKSVYQLLNEGIYNRTIFRFELTDRHNNQRTRIIPIFTPQQYLDYVNVTEHEFIIKLLSSQDSKKNLKFFFDPMFQGKQGDVFEDLFRRSFQQGFKLKFKIKDQNFEFIHSTVETIDNFLGYYQGNPKYKLNDENCPYKEQFFDQSKKKKGQCIGYYTTGKKNQPCRTNPGFDFMFLKYLQDDIIEWNTIDFTTTKAIPKSKMKPYQDWMKRILLNTTFDEKNKNYMVISNRKIKIKFIHFVIGLYNSTEEIKPKDLAKDDVKEYHVNITDIDFTQYSSNSPNQLFLKKLGQIAEEMKRKNDP